MPGVLDDYVFLGHSCLDMWEALGIVRYYDAAEEIARTLLSRFYDGKAGGFFDTAIDAPNRLGALVTRRKPLQDAPTPAGNPAGAVLFMRLHALSGNEAYRDTAQETLEYFAGIVEHLGLYAATYALALGRFSRPATQVVVVGEGEAAAQLEVIALAGYAVNKSVIRLRHDQLATLPPALAQTLPHLPEAQGAFALVCSGSTCQPPVTGADGLIAALHSAGPTDLLHAE